MLRMTPVALALAMAWGVAPATAFAQDNTQKKEGQPTAAKLKEVTVTATRTARQVDEVPVTVTVTTQDDIQRKGASNVKEMFKDELGVSIRQQTQRAGTASFTGRAGAESINIRGIEGNRVMMTIDGVRVPDAYTDTASIYLGGRAESIDVEMLKSAEILRGASSTQFGSDGLAGAVSFRTLDPSDLIKDGATTGGFISGSYANVDKSYGVTGGVATRSDNLETMMVLNYRKGHETRNRGKNDSSTSARTKANPQDYDRKSALLKGNIIIDAANKVGLTLDVSRRKVNTDVLSGLGPQFMGSIPLGTFHEAKTKDSSERTRVMLDHQYVDVNGSLLQRAETKFYWQDTKAKQLTFENRTTSSVSTTGPRWRDNRLDNRTFGLSTLFESNISDQKWTYGLDASRSDIKALRDGGNPNGTSQLGGSFPKTKTTLAGAFIQGEINLGFVNILPGVRYEYFKLNADTNHPGMAKSISDKAISPRLGVVLPLAPLFAPYAQWAKGFKAPTPDQLNPSFSNGAQNYEVIPNPNLKPERSTTIEAGFRGKTESFNYSVTAFHSKFDGFIDVTTVGGGGKTIYQYLNQEDATIKGLELRATNQLTSNLILKMGVGYTKGESKVNNVTTPLDSVDPLKATLGLAYDAENWGATADVTYSAAKETKDMETKTNFATPSFAVLDLGMHWKPVRNMTVSANVNNVTDAKYWNWSDARGIGASSTLKDAFAAPGRNAQVSLRYDF